MSFVYGVDSVCVCVNPLCLSVFRMASTIMQVYLKHVLDSFFHSHTQVRLAAIQVVVLVLQQGLVHPVQVSKLQYTSNRTCRHLRQYSERIYICNCTTRLVQTLCQYPVNTRINKLVPNICHVQTFTCVH